LAWRKYWYHYRQKYLLGENIGIGIGSTHIGLTLVPTRIGLRRGLVKDSIKNMVFEVRVFGFAECLA
jgi:hypothetical protein